MLSTSGSTFKASLSVSSRICVYRVMVRLMSLKFVYLPGASPVGFWIAFNALETPISGAYGGRYLLPPMVDAFSLGSIPANGVLVLSGTIPASCPITEAD